MPIGKFIFKYYWWILQVFLLGLSIFFLVFGIQLLMSAYKLNQPGTFIMTFFASNLMILISIALGIGFICRMVGVYRGLHPDGKGNPDENES